MRIRTQLIVLASFTLAPTGCSTQSQTANSPKNNNLGAIDVSAKHNDLGAIDVSSGKPTKHTLTDGSLCFITPAILSNGNISLLTSVYKTNGSQTTLVSEMPAEKGAYTYAVDKDTIVTVEFTGSSLHTASVKKNNNLGAIKVSSNKPTSHTLADGRVCTITPTLLPDGFASLAVRIDEANGSGQTKVFQSSVDGRAYAFGFDSNTVITVALSK